MRCSRMSRSGAVDAVAVCDRHSEGGKAVAANVMQPRPIDLVVLSRDGGPLDGRVRAAILAQRGVLLKVYGIIGERRHGDAHRWTAICRARNRARTLGTSPWLMFLDDDVVLDRDCVRRLSDALHARPECGAVAADYIGERHSANATGHVGMGATLFRRSALQAFQFRWQPGRCECQCCCDDLRAAGIGIGYVHAASATHLKSSGEEHGKVALPPPHVIVAFDRRHVPKFRHRFLRTLRGRGNSPVVTAVTYGLYPSEEALVRSAGVRTVPMPVNGTIAPVRRLRDFQIVLAALPPLTPVAYWDAGDVVFQASLDPLWNIVRANPGKLLAVREPKSHPGNAAVAAWTLSVRDPAMRRRAFRLLSTNPFLNSGFAAGTASALLEYCREAVRMLRSRDLAGTSDWGDQTALNLYCHAQPHRWLEVEEGWNYCLHDREPGEFAVRPDGVIASRKGTSVFVVHGNAKSLRKLELSASD